MEFTQDDLEFLLVEMIRQGEINLFYNPFTKELQAHVPGEPLVLYPNEMN